MCYIDKGYLVTCQAPNPNRMDDNNFVFVATFSTVCRPFLYSGTQTQRAERQRAFLHSPPEGFGVSGKGASPVASVPESPFWWGPG